MYLFLWKRSDLIPRGLFRVAIRIHKPPILMHDVVVDAAKQASVSKEIDMTLPHWAFGLQSYTNLLSDHYMSNLPCASVAESHQR
jgi:hypothetical protein